MNLYLVLLLGAFVSLAVAAENKPAGRVYANEVSIDEKNGMLTLKLEVDTFQAGDFAKKVSDYESIASSWKPAGLSVMVEEKGAKKLPIYNDHHNQLGDALAEAMNDLPKIYSSAYGTFFGNIGIGEDMRLDIQIGSAKYDPETSNLALVGRLVREPLPLLYEDDEEGASGNVTNGCTSVKQCSGLVKVLDKYAGVLELWPQKRKPYAPTDREAIESCSTRHMLRLTCVGGLCANVLRMVGVDDVSDSNRTTSERIISSKQCCELMQDCESDPNAQGCSLESLMKDTGGGNKVWSEVAGMTVGDHMSTTDAWQAQCWTDCSVGNWGECRFGRKRCGDDCRCAWWC